MPSAGHGAGRRQESGSQSGEKVKAVILVGFFRERQQTRQLSAASPDVRSISGGTKPGSG
jgi:uncharacterized protein (UPF0548 family)